MNYSQSNEEQVIVDYFNGETGRFLDCAAFDGVTYSNTLQLIQLGWSGVAVEASPRAFTLLQDNYRQYPSVQLFHALITNEPGIFEFHVSDHPIEGVSTVSAPHRRKWERDVRYQTIHMPGIPVQQIFERFEQFDFISLDLEGTNWSILQQIKLDIVQCLCVEHDTFVEPIRAYCRYFGLTQELLLNAENIILARPRN